jgi:hypothetical protein
MVGLSKLVAIKFSMNRGLSDELKVAFAFQNVVPVARPLVNDKTILDLNLLAGFTSAEGCFYIHIQKSLSNKIEKFNYSFN